jgi:hypothetical protein
MLLWSSREDYYLVLDKISYAYMYTEVHKAIAMLLAAF